jgi:hypothetical protein
MILVQGKILPNSHQQAIIDHLYPELLATLKNVEPINAEMVIKACDVLYRRVVNHEYDDVILPLISNMNIPYDFVMRNAVLFSASGLRKKVKMELGDELPSTLDENNTRQFYPLGILLHIAAGNVDGLPAYSVVEGLLTGNINILKLPSGDSGLSISLLSALIEIEPRLAPFIYVFDVPSLEIETIKTLATYADGVVIWGGDEVNMAARQFVDIKTKIISWGHKLSFAYVDESVTDEELKDLAYSLCLSNQLLCSSVQGIYVDTDDERQLLAFSRRFFALFKQVNNHFGPAPLGAIGKNTIRLYNDILEQGNKQENILFGDGVSVICKEDSELELSYLFRNVWVKRLPHDKIIEVLKQHKNHLQSVGLSVKREAYEIISHLFAQAGLVRITALKDTSRILAGEAHDGEYPLRRYSRIVEKVVLPNTSE